MKKTILVAALFAAANIAFADCNMHYSESHGTAASASKSASISKSVADMGTLKENASGPSVTTTDRTTSGSIGVVRSRSSMVVHDNDSVKLLVTRTVCTTSKKGKLSTETCVTDQRLVTEDEARSFLDD